MASTATTKKKAANPKATATKKQTNGGKAKNASATPSPNGNGGANGKTVAEVLTQVNKTGLAKLGKGGLEQLVVKHLAANPRADVTPSEVANKLNRSSGAVGNALERLVKAGKATRTNEQPRRYRHKPSRAKKQAARK
jgi:hypothetical protein